MVPAQASVGPDPPECRVPVDDQPDTIAGVCENGPLHEGRFRRAESRPDKIIIEIRRSQGELGLLQRKKTVMVPWDLPERDKGKRVARNQLGVCLLCLADVGEKLRPEKSQRRLRRLERQPAAEYLAAVVSCHPYGSDLRGVLVGIEIGGTIDASAPVGQENSALRVVW